MINIETGLETNKQERCNNKDGHEYKLWKEIIIGGKLYQYIKCSKCGKVSIGWKRVKEE